MKGGCKGWDGIRDGPGRLQLGLVSLVTDLPSTSTR